MTHGFGGAVSLLLLLSGATDQEPRTKSDPFGIQVVDEQTGRGVPLVGLVTTNGIVLITDSAGWVAIDEPGLVGERVFFSVISHGYSFPKDGFGNAGRELRVTPGETATLKVARINIRERPGNPAVRLQSDHVSA